MAAVFIRWFEDIGAGDTGSVGGKNASLGEMVRNLGRAGTKVPPGFAITIDGYRHFLSANNLAPVIAAKLAELKGGNVSSAEIGSAIRTAIETGEWPKDLADAISHAYRDLSRRLGVGEADVAVRSSATAEDLPEASFAGQQASFLNVRGEAALLDAARRCFASLFTDRAISYREAKGFEHLKVALSVGVQQMVRSDLAGAGVMFSIDTETGFDRVVLINAAWGLGENVVQGPSIPMSTKGTTVLEFATRSSFDV
jgi:pyruvate,water dikinase